MFGQFFASVVSPELSRFGGGDDKISWNLPATNLSIEQLGDFNLKEMERHISSEAPALSSFLSGICGKPNPGCHRTDIDMDVDEIAEDSGDDLEDNPEARQRVSPARLLDIVSLLHSCAFVAYNS